MASLTGLEAVAVAKGLEQELEDVSKHVDQARASVKAHDWLRAAQALLEVQDRVGRVLREIELARSQPMAGSAASKPPPNPQA
jgi:hypothetical protein